MGVGFLFQRGSRRAGPLRLVVREPKKWSPVGSREDCPSQAWLAAAVTGVLLAFAGLGAWGLSARWQSQEMARENERLAARLREAQPARGPFDPQTGLVEPGVLRGWVILKTWDGKRRPAPHVRLKLYDRQKIEAHLAAEIPRILKAEGRGALATLVAELPEPIATSVTDSNGAFEFRSEQPGDFVIVASALIHPQGVLRVWFLGVDAADPFNTPIFLTESNALVSLDPLLAIQPAR